VLARQNERVPTSWGSTVEAYARRLAGGFGVPDFVYEPTLQATGSGNRELSDGLLICGEDGLIVQVKARDPGKVKADTPERAERWVQKKAREGAGQADGTRRRLMTMGPTTFKSLRGFERRLASVKPWPAVVLIEHPRAPSNISLDVHANTVFMTVDDWYGLHERLRSTAAVITYVQRALVSGVHPDLGNEVLRYGAHAEADAVAAGGGYPMLPAASIHGEDETYAAFVDDLIEKVWPQDGPWPWSDPDDYRLVIEALDRIPPAMRADLGRKMFNTLLEVRRTRERRSFFLAHSQFLGRFIFVYDLLDNVSSEDQMARLVALTSVRQQEAVESGTSERPGTLGVGVLHDEDQGRQYSFVFSGGRPAPPTDVRWRVNSVFGVLNRAGIRSLPPIGRNDPCGCGSGAKFKYCCGP
jgi:SEC-C motif